MAKLDLKRVLQRYNLSTKEVADVLFPNVKNPDMSLNRVKRGEGDLSSEQVVKLAALADVQIQALFEPKWAVRGREGDVVNFEHGDYKAVLNLDTWETTLFKKGSMFHTQVLTKKALDIKEYFELLNEIVSKAK